MLNLCEGHVFVELNYPHLIGIRGYERHHDVAIDPGISPFGRRAANVPTEAIKLRVNNGEARADHPKP
jgi:hypothetical protein